MATNYNNIKWGTNTPTVIAWKADANHTYYPGIIKWGSNVVFARAVEVDDSTTKTGMSGITGSLTGFTVPTNVSRASGYFYGDQITATATYQTYWTGSTTATKSLSELFSLTTSTTPSKYYLRDLFTPSRAGTRSITVKGDSHVTVTGSYTKLNGSAATVSTKSTTAKIVNDAWQGAQIVTSTAVDTYYKLASSSGIGTTAAGTANVSAEATSTQKVRKVTVKKVTSTHAAASSFVVSYYSNASTSVSKTAAGTYDSFSGKDITWTVTAPNYCTAVSPSGTVAAANNENAITVDTGCTRNARTLAVKGDSHAQVTITYTNTSGSTGQTITTKSTTAASTTTAWQGATASAGVVYDNYYKKSSETNIGTIAVGNTTVTASATSQEKKRAIDVAFNTGIHAITVKYQSASGTTVTATPTAAGAVTNSSFSGAQITCTPVASIYYTITSNGNIAAANNETKVTVSPTAGEKKRAIDVVFNSNITRITITYQPNNGTIVTSGTTGTCTVTNSSFSGAKVTYTAIAASYYTTSGGELPAADNTTKVTVSPTASEKKRAIDATLNANVASLTVKYQPSSGTTVTVTPTASGAITNSSFSGAKVTWNATASTYWTMTTSGEIPAADNTTKVTVSPTATRRPRGVSVQISNCAVIATYVNLSGTATSRTVVGAPSQSIDDVWSGAALTASVVANTYYSLTSSSGTGTNAASESNLTISGSATEKMRKVYNSSSSPISLTITYYVSNSATSSATLTAGQNRSVWCGQVTTYSWAAAPQYAAHQSGTQTGTVASNNTTADVTLSPSLTGLTRNLVTQVTYNQSLVESLANNVTLKLNGAACYGSGAWTNETWSQTSSQSKTHVIAQGSTYTLVGVGLPSTATYYEIEEPSSYSITKGASNVTREFTIARRPRMVQFIATGNTGGRVIVDYGSYDSTTTNEAEGSIVTLTVGSTATHTVPNYWSGYADNGGEVDFWASHGSVLVGTTSSISSSRPFTTLATVTYNNSARGSDTTSFPDPGITNYTIYIPVIPGYRVTIPKPGLGRNNITYGVCAYSSWTGSQPGTINGTTSSTSTTINIGVATGDLVVWYSTVKSYFTATGAGTAINNYGKVTYGNVGASDDFYNIPTPTATPITRDVRITKNGSVTLGLTSAKVTGYNPNTTTSATWNIPVNKTTGSIFSTWIGGAATLTAVAKNQYWTATGTGTVAIGQPTGTVTYTFSLGAQLVPSAEEVSQGNIYITIYNPTTSAMTVTYDSNGSLIYDEDGSDCTWEVNVNYVSRTIAAGSSFEFAFTQGHVPIYEYSIYFDCKVGSTTFNCIASNM